MTMKASVDGAWGMRGRTGEAEGKRGHDFPLCKVQYSFFITNIL